MLESQPIKRVLVANRGLPAIEIVEAVQSMGLEAAIAAAPSDTGSAAYAKADVKTGLPVGPSHVERDSYMNILWMLDAAERLDADSIHPGYGFLSEEPEFARQVELTGKRFIGPKQHALRIFGSKTRFRQHARENDVPVIPASRQYIFTDGSPNGANIGQRVTGGMKRVGSIVDRGYSVSRLPRVWKRLDNDRVKFARTLAGVVTERMMPTSLEVVVDEAIAFIRQNGDIVVKSPYGGGGMGTMLLRGIADELNTDWARARNRIESAILAANRVSIRDNKRGIYFEKLIDSAGHLEMQVIADEHGNVHVMGFERDCSWQLRERKMVEQSPSSKITEEERQALRKYAKKIIEGAYSPGIFTVEFLKEMNEGGLYALEVNPRLQVEHKVTELVTWMNENETLELIPTQVRIANGEKIESFPHESRGHAVEARILVNVDERNGGHLSEVRLPSGPGIKVITNFGNDYFVPGGYDGHIAKILVTGDDADMANSRLLEALKQTHLGGQANNIDFIIENLQRPEFLDGSYTTKFVADAAITDVFRFQG